MHKFLAASILFGALALALGPAAASAKTYGPVTITACSLGQSGNVVANNSLEIKYFNNQPGRTLDSVTFAIRYRGVWQTVTDTGKFTYGAAIDHTFNNFSGLPWEGPNPGICRVKTAVYGDGQVYQF